MAINIGRCTKMVADGVDFTPIAPITKTVKGKIEEERVIVTGCKPGYAYRIEDPKTGRSFYGTADANGKVEARP